MEKTTRESEMDQVLGWALDARMHATRNRKEKVASSLVILEQDVRRLSRHGTVRGMRKWEAGTLNRTADDGQSSPSPDQTEHQSMQFTTRCCC